MIKLSIVMSGIAVTLLATTLQAKPTIPKAFILECQQKNILHAYTTFEAVIDKEGNPRCQGMNKTAEPHCPRGYIVKKRFCIKMKAREKGLEKAISK